MQGALEAAGNRRLGGDAEYREKLRILLEDRRIPLIHEKDFENLGRLGHGSFARVELIRYEGRLYAQKKPLSNFPMMRNSIIEEGLKLSEFRERHRNIQQLYYVTQGNNAVFGFVIDYCSSGSLDNVVKNKAIEYTLVDAINWGYQLADALTFLHDKRLVHRDVKMQNILLKDDRQTVVLTDYGTVTTLQKAIMTINVGSHITMAPEVVSSRDYSEKCDTFSWSIVFWQLITRAANPYGGVRTFIFEVTNQKLRPAKIKGFPPLLTALLYRSWHSNPNERPSSYFLKTLLKFILSKLPKKIMGFEEEIQEQMNKKWVDENQLPREYLPVTPRVGNNDSMNTYHEHFEVMERVISAKKRIDKLEKYKELLDQNEKLSKRLEELRSETEKILPNKIVNSNLSQA